MKYSKLKEKLNLKVDNQNGESLAAFTHFLQSKDNGASKYFKKSASDYISTLEEISILKDEGGIQYNLPLEFDVPFPPTANPEFTFIDLFAGIGGFRIAFQEQGGKCVFSSEWDNFARKTYEANFGEVPFGDITKIQAENVPDHDILCAGFPCQPFSIAGVSKKKSLGKQHGFLDKTQGTLFDDIVRIIKKKRPKAFLLENVKNLRSHDNGKTYLIIKEALRELNYQTFDRIIDAADYVPQHRERIFIVGYDKNRYGEDINFEFPSPPQKEQKLKNILNPEEDDKYTLTDNLWKYLKEYANKHKEKGNGFGFGLADLDDISRTLSARYHKDGSEILIPQGKSKNPRRLSPEECKRLMGFPEKFNIRNIGVSDTQLYRQFGNSVSVPVANAIASKMLSSLKELERPTEQAELKEI